MTTIDEALSPVEDPSGGPAAEGAAEGLPGAPAVPRRLRRLLGFVLGLAIGFALCVGVASAGLLVWDSGYDGRVLAGVHVGGVDLSGLDRDQAVATLDAAYASYGAGQVVLHTPGGDVSVPYSAFARRPDTGPMVDGAMAVGRDGTTLERAVEEVRLALDGRTLTPRVVLDEAALTSAVRRALLRLELAPLDAVIVTRWNGVVTMPARSGRTFDAGPAAAAVLAAVRGIDAPDQVIIDVPAIELQPARGDAEVLAARSAMERMASNVVVTFGKKHWTLKASQVKGWLGFETAADGAIRPAADLAAIPPALGKVAKAIRTAPVSAVYLTGRGRVVGVAPGQDGRRLDAEATAVAIANELTARASGAAPSPVRVQIEKVPPKLTTEEATKKGPLMTRLGSWKTWFPVSDRNYYGANIWLPAKFIDGTVLYPGQTFEWWRAVGPVTTARGFGLGGYIAGDHTEPTGAIGGGMCSSSTTLFNAALRAGLKMGARSNHKYYIYRYPLGLDATVSKSLGGGGQTMSFTNDMRTPIVIRSFRYTAGGVGWVRYEIWGMPDGRTVSLSSPQVWNVQKATTNKVYVSNLPHGVSEQTEYPANGMDVSVTRTVRDGHGRVIHRDTYRTHYTLWNGRIEIGR